jgi:hypothetical protein
VLGGLNKNFGLPSVNIFPEYFSEIFGETSQKEQKLSPPSRHLAAVVFRLPVSRREAEHETATIWFKTFLKNLFGNRATVCP